MRKSHRRGTKDAETRLNRRFTRRTLLLASVQAAIAGGLVARMYQLQVIETERYHRLSDRNRVRQRIIPPIRGEIYDIKGRLLAENRQNYRVTILSSETPEPEKTLEQVAKLISIPESKRKKLLTEIKESPSFQPIVIAENLTWKEFSHLNANAPALRGVDSKLGWTRYYPHGKETAHCIGYVGKFSEGDRRRADAQDKVFETPGIRIGRSGIEYAQETTLRGISGYRSVEVNNINREIRELERTESLPGDALVTTLDLDLQRYITDRLSGYSGGAVVMDIHTGEVRAMVSMPSFDPNPFVVGISTTAWNSLLNDPLTPMNNRAVSGLYAPASTFKMLVGIAGLETGAITANSSFHCSGSLQLGNRPFHCWRRGGHGKMHLVDAIKQSCDVYFYEVSRKIGIDKLAEYAREFGIGIRPELTFPNLTAGTMPDRDWKLRVYDVPWLTGDTFNTGIGQGYLQTTPLQLAIMTARIANGGRKVQPRLIKSINGVEPEQPPIQNIAVKQSSLDIIRNGMFAVVNEAGGTGFQSRIDDPNMQMAGKTGTAQNRSIRRAERESGVRRNDQLERRLRDDSLFVGYAPYHAPRYAVAVILEHAGNGSTAAAPAVRDILIHTLKDSDITEIQPKIGSPLTTTEHPT